MSVLKDKSYKEYKKTSRYSATPYYYNTLDNKYMYGVPLALNDNTEFNYYIVEKEDTLDYLSIKYYGTPAYYWVIADFNHILNPFEELVVGSVIKIPQFSTITFTKKGRF